MKKTNLRAYLLVSLVIFLVISDSYAQRDNQRIGQGRRGKDVSIFDQKKSTSNNGQSNNSGKKGESDDEDKSVSSSTVTSESTSSRVRRYAHYTIRHGWFEGIGPVSEEQAKHMTNYYEFSEMNAAGHWGRVRVLNGYGRMEGTYLFQKAFTNLDWDRASWQWDDIPKETVDIRISEGESEGDIVYIYYDASGKQLCKGYVRKLDEQSVLMHFSLDNHDTIPLYRNRYTADCELIYCRRDENGFDVYQKFYSRYGGLAVNTDSAFAVNRTYDGVGNRLSDRSLGIIDNPVIDFAGNNGWTATYDQWGCELTLTNMDIYWQPMIPETSDASRRHIRQHYVYDKYHRLIRQFYTDEQNQPMADGDGLSSVTFAYNDRGLLTEYKLFDVNGNPFDSCGYFCCRKGYDSNGYLSSCFYYNTGDSLSERTYHFVYDHDAQGNETFYECRDENGMVQNDSEGIARRRVSYKDNGAICNKDTWSLDSVGNLILTYYRHENADSIIVFNLEREYRDVYLKDCTGRTCEDYRLNLLGDTIPSPAGNSRYYYRDVYHRSSQNGVTTILNVHYDENNRVIFNEDWSESYGCIDSTKQTKHWKDYDANHNVVYNDKCYYPLGFEDKTFMVYQKLNSFDVSCWVRSGKYTFFKTLVTIDPIDNLGAMYAYFNEWNEPAYVVRNNREAYHIIFKDDMENSTFDENGLVIDPDSLFNVLPKAISIEVVDSVAYKYGIRDNDIILKYGDWQHINDWTKKLDYAFYLETIIQANRRKTMLVLRSDTALRKTWVEEISLENGRLSDLGINPVLRCLTSKENQRLTTAFDVYKEQNDVIKQYKEYRHSGKKWVIVCCPIKKGYTHLYNDLELRSPFILLMQNFYPISDEDTRDSSLLPANQWIFEEEAWSNRYEEITSNNDSMDTRFFYTDNLATTSMLDSVMKSEDVDKALSYGYLRVSDSIYTELIKLRESLKRDGYQVRELASVQIASDTSLAPKYKPMEVIALWSAVSGMMDIEDIKDAVDEDIFSWAVDINKCRFYGIQVDEDESPELVVAYNNLLLELDRSKLSLIRRVVSSEGEMYIWCKKRGKNTAMVEQLVIYNRNKFIVVNGKFQIPWWNPKK